MKREDLHKLLGGYATGTLTEREREALFRGALEDQELFDALANEEALRALLADRTARAELLAGLSESSAKAGWLGWWRRPAVLAAAGAFAVAILVLVSVPKPADREPWAKGNVPAAPEARRDLAPDLQPAEEGARGSEEKSRTVAKARLPAAAGLARNEASAPAPARPLRVAVVRQPSAAAVPVRENGPVAQLEQKLAETRQFAVVDARDVDRQMARRKSEPPALDAPSAARLGRELGADAVVLGQAAALPAAPAAQVAETFSAAPPSPAAQEARLSGTQDRPQSLTAAQSLRKQQAMAMVTAEVIDTRNLANRFRASGTVDEVAAQVNSQLARLQSEAASWRVVSVSGVTVMLAPSADRPLAVGARLDVWRETRHLGELIVTHLAPDAITARFSGAHLPRPGDLAKPVPDGDKGYNQR